jgi:hypothetical protein
MQIHHRQCDKDRRRNDAAERDDDTELGLDAKKIAQAMCDRNSELGGDHFDRRRLQGPTPATAAIRLGHDQADVMASFVEAAKGARRDEWRTEKDESDYSASG